MTQEEYFIQKNAVINGKRKYNKSPKGKKKHYIELYMTNPISRINKEKPFDKAAYMKEYKVRKKLDTKNLTRNMAKVVTRKQECSLKSHPQCLKIFITNQEDTVCLRCQNYK